LDWIRKADTGLARGEGAIAAVVLLSMIVLASIQALFRNLTYLDLSFANDALTELAWIDDFLKKGTLWLAFLGASLATREERHIGIDVLPKLLNDQGKRFVRGLVGIAAGLICLMLARAFWGAVLINGEERPLRYEVLADGSAMHICEATAAQLAANDLSAPGIFCALRSGLASMNVPVETPSAAAQLIVPVAFVFMAIRFFGHGIHGFMQVVNPPPKTAESEAAEAAHDVPGPVVLPGSDHLDDPEPPKEAPEAEASESSEADDADETSEEKGEA
jgi:TRAP-type C4-dicarboxylate transport system permease small subunit